MWNLRSVFCIFFGARVLRFGIAFIVSAIILSRLLRNSNVISPMVMGHKSDLDKKDFPNVYCGLEAVNLIPVMQRSLHRAMSIAKTVLCL